jgi:hypothetical protein
MGVYDDLKKVLQDTLTPDVKALREAVDQNEKRAQERHEMVLREVGLRFDAMNYRFDSLNERIDLSRRVENLERTRDEEKAH